MAEKIILNKNSKNLFPIQMDKWNYKEKNYQKKKWNRSNKWKNNQMSGIIEKKMKKNNLKM